MGWRPKNCWLGGLLWGTALSLYYVTKHAIAGELTLAGVGEAFLLWEAGGILFGLAIAAVLSPLTQQNLFRAFPDKEGSR